MVLFRIISTGILVWMFYGRMFQLDESEKDDNN